MIPGGYQADYAKWTNTGIIQDVSLALDRCSRSYLKWQNISLVGSS